MTTRQLTDEQAHARRRHVAPRGISHPSDYRQKQVVIRLTTEASSRLASLQGLVLAHGERETLAKVFETIFLPAFERYVAERGYIDRAKAERTAKEEVANV